jgi:hypothetical protein
MKHTKDYLEFLKKRERSKRYTAKRDGLEFGLTIEYMDSIRVEYCYSTGLRLDWNDTLDWRSDETPYLIRIDCSKGFVRDNVIWVSRRYFLSSRKDEESRREFYQALQLRAPNYLNFLL